MTEDQDIVAALERVEKRATAMEHEAAHVTSPAFGEPWGADIIERLKHEASDLRILLAYVQQLKADGFELAAGFCEHRAGDERGHPWCLAMKAHIPERTASNG